MDMKERENALLRDLLAAQGPAPAAPTSEQRRLEPANPTPPKPLPPARQRAASTIPAGAGLYKRVQASIALCFAITIAAGLWWGGAYFTLQALATFGIVLAGVGWWQWLIPVAITASELALWPHRASSRLQGIFFAGVVIFDVGTSFAGLAAWGAGRPIPLFQGMSIPPAGPGLIVFALAVALILAFIPERLVRWAGPDLVALWK